jgi:hypothetical protein
MPLARRTRPRCGSRVNVVGHRGRPQGRAGAVGRCRRRGRHRYASRSSMRRHHRVATNDHEQGGHGLVRPRSMPRPESASNQRGRNIRQVQGRPPPARPPWWTPTGDRPSQDGAARVFRRVCHCPDLGRDRTGPANVSLPSFSTSFTSGDRPQPTKPKIWRRTTNASVRITTGSSCLITAGALNLHPSRRTRAYRIGRTARGT